MSDVLLIGLGGLGCPVVMAMSAARPDLDWLVCDGDVVDRSNLPRQWLYTDADIGRRKTDVVAATLRRVTSAPAVTKAQLPGLIANARVVIEASDDVELKFAVNDAVVKAGKRMVIGGITGVDGFALAYTDGACLRCVFERPTDDMRRTCADAGVIAPGPTVVGASMAAAALRLLDGAYDGFWSFALREGRSRAVGFSRAPHCEVHKC